MAGAGLKIYQELLTTPHVARFVIGGVIAQFPYGMVSMAVLIGVRDGYGSYSLAGLAAAVMAASGALCGPIIGRQVDKWGQRRVAVVVAAFWLISHAFLAWVLTALPPLWVLIVAVLMLGVSVPSGALLRARWPLALYERGGMMNSALSLTSVLEESMWVLSTPIATVLATLVAPTAPLLFSACAIVVGLYLLLGNRIYEPIALVDAAGVLVPEQVFPGGPSPGAAACATPPLSAVVTDTPSPDAANPAAPPLTARINEAPNDSAVSIEVTQAGNDNPVGASPRPIPPRYALATVRLWTASFVALLIIQVFYGAFQSTTGIAVVAFAREQGVQEWAGVVTACFSAASMIAAVLYGMKQWRSSLLLRFYLGLAALALGCSALVMVPSMAAAGAVMFISGLFQAPTVVNLNQMLFRIVPSSRLTEGMAHQGAMWVVGMSTSNLVAGAVIDRYGALGGFGTIRAFAAIALVIAVGAYMPLKRRVGSSS
ncbi:MFS transporter [Schaalia suimastitidis]|uniref:MFS transporter n=1 Tax=Schaalia suimastitidis TaxID=121163 RepID=UPI000422F662|nr:MFS transporter [Schaalia suimastitidis]